MDKKNIRKNFSKAAYFYDRYADIQKKSAFELLNRLPEKKTKNILEIGCGTGNYSFLLRKRFKNAELKALDISEDMLDVARRKFKSEEVEFIAADAENVDLKEEFDLITSNACFQWFEDLEKALIKYKSMLRKNGVLSFSFFGPLTFCELDKALKCLFNDACVGAVQFLGKDQIKDLLGKYFKNIRIEEMRCQEKFLHLGDLLKKIKYTGTSGKGLGAKRFFGPRQLKMLETAYLDRCKEIIATYQIFFCEGRRA